MKFAVIIETNGQTRTRATPSADPERELDLIQKWVDGYFESPSILMPMIQSLTMFCNEDGKHTQEPNFPATLLLGYKGHDLIHGPVVIMGKVDAHGDTRGLTAHEAAIIVAACRTIRTRIYTDLNKAA